MGICRRALFWRVAPRAAFSKPATVGGESRTTLRCEAASARALLSCAFFPPFATETPRSCHGWRPIFFGGKNGQTKIC